MPRLLSLLLLLVCCWPPVLANIGLQYQIYELPLSMVSARRVGQWQSGDLKGYLRVFLVEREGRRPISHELYIQWVCDCDIGQVAILPVAEFNGDIRYQLTEPQWRFSQGVNLLEFNALNVHNKTQLFVQVQLRDIGDIQVVARRTDSVDSRFADPAGR